MLLGSAYMERRLRVFEAAHLECAEREGPV